MCYSEKFEAFPDNQADAKIQALMVYCPNKDGGCSWVGKVNQVSEHCDSDQLGCSFQEIKCPNNCGRSLRRKNVEIHLMTECPCYCQHCKITGDEILIAEQHKENCQKIAIQCPNGCGAITFRESINEHCKVCPLEEIQCEYHNLGCKSIMLRKNKEEHNRYNAVEHLDLWRQNISHRSYFLSYMLILLLLLAVLSYTYVILSGNLNIKYEMESKYHEIELKYHDMELKYHEMNAKLSHEVEQRNQKMEERNQEMEQKYHKMNATLSQQLGELKKENRELKANISWKQEVLKLTMIWLEYRVNEYITSEELQHLNSFLEFTHYDCIEAVNEQAREMNKLTESVNNLTDTIDNNHRNTTKETIKLTESLNKLENTIYESYGNLSATVDRTNKQMSSDIWRIHLSILCLLALHDNQVVPVVLVISNYSEWVKENETWYSPFFMDTRHGNQFYLSVNPVETELSIHLHLATHSKKYGLRSGIFIIEVLNLISDSKHSAGKIHFNNTISFVSKAAGDAKLFERKIVGYLNHSFPQYPKNATYILRDELFLRVSFISDK